MEIQASQQVDYGGLADILVRHVQTGVEATQLIAIRWLREFVDLAKEQLLPQYAAILAAVLPCLSHPSPDIASVRDPRGPHRSLLLVRQ